MPSGSGDQNTYTHMYFFRIYISIDRAVKESGHGKYVLDVLNNREKWMINSATAKLLNTELILDNPIFQVHAGS